MDAWDNWFTDNVVPEQIAKVWPEAARVASTDAMDKTTAEDRNKLVGFCESCEQWHKFVRGTDKEACPNCGSKFSNRIGFQLTSQRTFNEAAAKKKKLPKRK